MHYNDEVMMVIPAVEVATQLPSSTPPSVHSPVSLCSGQRLAVGSLPDCYNCGVLASGAAGGEVPCQSGIHGRGERERDEKTTRPKQGKWGGQRGNTTGHSQFRRIVHGSVDTVQRCEGQQNCKELQLAVGNVSWQALG